MRPSSNRSRRATCRRPKRRCKVLREQQARLERETAARVQAEVRIDALARNLAQLQQEAAQHQAQAKAHALQAARQSVSGELAEMATELDRLRDALGDHDGLLKEYRDRLRVEQEHRLSVQAELERVKTATVGASGRRTGG